MPLMRSGRGFPFHVSLPLARFVVPCLTGSSLAAALLLGVPGVLCAQGGAIAGTIRLAGSESPAVGATVVLVGTRHGAITDESGGFRITDVPTGLYTVEARRLGATVERTAAAIRPGQTTVLELALALAPAELAGVEVIGKRADALARLPGSAAVISSEELTIRQPVSANEVLRTLPGVHIQEEEGVGLRANIGIRGLDPDRSRTVLVLEDGLPVALAPYGEPEMYYSPPIDRMERVEVMKGSGSIVYGPQTVGGVINYVTAEAPVRPSGQLLVQGGGGSFLAGRLRYGGTWGPARGNVGVFHKQARDLNGLFFDVSDVTTKLGFRGAGRGDIGVKLSVYDEISNATYVGLTDSLFRASPNVHPSPGDRLRLQRYAATATHGYALGEATTLRTSVYAYHTTRDWQRRDFTYASGGQSILFRNTTGNRNRSFDVVGAEPRIASTLRIAGIRSDLDAGVRVHYERARDQHINGSTATSFTGEIQDDEIRTGRALSAFVQNRFFLSDALTVTPGLRLERFEFDRHILRTRVRRETPDGTTRAPENVDIRSGDVVAEVIPGLGAAWSPTALVTVFAGAHRGFAPPRAKDALIYEDPVLAPNDQVPAPVSLQLDAERSWNYEVGTRLRPVGALALEATLFYLDFANQIVEPSLSAGSVSQAALANQGATVHRGVEGSFALDVGKVLRQPYAILAEGNLTLVDARFSRQRLLERAPGDTADIEGNRLPYAPEWLANAALTFVHPTGLTSRLEATWVGDQFSDNFETVDGSANGRTGLIPAYRVVDLSLRYRVPGPIDLTVTGSVKNLLGETYIASRRPQGIKVGLPRLATFGVIWGF